MSGRPVKSAKVSVGIASVFFVNLVSFLVLVVTANVFGVAGRGYIALAVSVATMLGNFFCFSLSRTFLHFIHQKKIAALDFFKDSFFSIIFFFFLGFVFSCVVLCVLRITHVLFIEKLDFLGLLAAGLLAFGLLWQNYANYFYITLNRLGRFNIANFVFYGFILFFLVGAIFFFKNVHWFLLLYAAAFFVFSVWQIVDLFFLIRPRLHFAYLIEFVRPSFLLHIDTIGSYLFGPVYVLLVAHARPLSEVAIFQLAMQLCTVFTFVPKTLQMFISEKLSHLGFEEGWYYFKRMLNQLLYWLVPATFFYFLFGSKLIPGIFGRDFYPVTHALDIFVFPLVFLGSFTILINPFWIAKGYLTRLALWTLGIGVSTFVFAIFLVPKFGMWAAVFCLSLNYCLAFVVNGFFFWRTDNGIKFSLLSDCKVRVRG